MTKTTQYSCPNCGGGLIAISDDTLQCPYCGSDFAHHAIHREADALRAFLDQTKIEYVYNQRRNLYDAVASRYISKNDVKNYATEIKKYLPDDFQANFYLEALSGDAKKINELIRKIDADENYDLLAPIIHFLIASLETEFLLELNLLIERTYKKRDLKRYSHYSTELSKEAEKVSEGIYATMLPRDVFIAYSSKDMDKVSELCGELEAQGFSCFVAARNLRHGVGSVENYDEALKEAMDNCSCFVFVSSANSRSFACDAVKKEIPYIRSMDTQNAPPELRNNYRMIPTKYKKPRIEYRLDMAQAKEAASRITDLFFDGYEWTYDIDGVVDRLVKLLYEMPEEAFSEAAPTVTTPPSTPAPAPMPSQPAVQQCNHVEVIDPAVEATCTEAGRTEGSHCSLCGEILRQSVTVSPHGHHFGMWRVTKPATCTETGEQERSCSCGEKETKPIPSLGGHKPGKWETVEEATETENGLKVKKCTVCGEQTETASIAKKKTSHPAAPVDKEDSKNTKSAKPEAKAAVSAGDRLYNVRLVSYGNRKLSCIKLVREVLGLGLSEAMTLIESKNPLLAQSVSLAEAERVKNTFGDFEVSIEEMASNGSDSKSRAAKSRSKTASETPKAMSQASQGLKHVSNSDGNTCAINGIGTCADTDIVIPSTIGAYRVTAIGTQAFADRAGIRTVSIPDSVTSISGYAFYGCTGLTGVSIPDTVRDIGYSAFYGCESLTGAVLPKSLTSLGNYAFSKCAKLASAALPDSLTSLGAYAFSECESLTSAVIPSAVTRIEGHTFYRCARLATVVIPDSVTVIGENAFSGCESLASIRYEGTKKQWKKIVIKKSSSMTCMVECTDGTVKQKF